jgi:hypothetical protein
VSMISHEVASNFYNSFFLIGPIPETLGNCIELTGLHVSNNELKGTCRVHHAKLLQISIIRFFLIGPIPETLGNCIELMELHLYGTRTTTNRKVPVASAMRSFFKFL